MAQDKLWILLGKQLSGEISEEEKKELQELAYEEEDLPFLMELLEEDWKKKASVNPRSTKRELNDRWEHLSDQLFLEEEADEEEKESDSGESQKRGNRSLWYILAASIILFTGIGVYFYGQETTTLFAKKHEIVVKNGNKKKMMLPDHTTVWLNAGSTLTYDDDFGNKNRDIWLQGEGYFDVAKNASLPFMVHTSTLTVKVLGTVFNIRAYNDESQVQTTLLSGKVQVLLNQEKEEKVMLFPKEKLTVPSSNKKNTDISDAMAQTKKRKTLPVLPKQPADNKVKYQVVKLPVNAADSTFFVETAWIDNKVAFVNEPFKEVAKKMERKYNVHIVFEDKTLENVVMTGVFEKETVKESLQVLQLLTHFNYEIKQDSIYLYHPSTRQNPSTGSG